MLHQQTRSFARMTGRAGKLQHFRYGVAKVRGRWYYRYHKPIGRANWKGYQERYIRPKDLEAKQRLVFAPRPTSKQLRDSVSWEWRLPKMLAQATTPNQVLDAWILFRYRQPKRVSHYMMTLQRLVDLGGCEPTDWRLHVLLSRLRTGYKRVINPDKLVRIFSVLGLHKEMERFTRFLKPKLRTMKTGQLVSVLDSFGNAQLRDPSVVGLCLRYMRGDLPKMSSDDIISIIQALGSLEIRNSHFVAHATKNLMNRTMSLVQMRNLLAATRQARVRDYVLIELVTLGVRKGLSQKIHSQVICGIIRELSLLKIQDEELFTEVLTAYNPENVPLSSLIDLTVACAGLVDTVLLTPVIDELVDSIPLIRSKKDLADVVCSLNTVKPILRDSISVFTSLGERLVSIRGDSPVYDVPHVATVLWEHHVRSRDVWKTLVCDIRSGFVNYEPHDFLRTAAILEKLDEGTLGEPHSVIANEMAEWCLKRWEEFTPRQWDQMRTYIASDRFACNPWCKEQMEKWHPKSTDRKIASANA
jgi:hypothetical protein